MLPAEVYDVNGITFQLLKKEKDFLCLLNQKSMFIILCDLIFKKGTLSCYIILNKDFHLSFIVSQIWYPGRDIIFIDSEFH